MANLKHFNSSTGQWEEIKVSTRFKDLLNTVKLIQDQNHVGIGITNYNPVEDVIFVFQNSIWLQKNEDYIVNGGLLRIESKDGSNWISGDTFNFVVLKNVDKDNLPSADGSLIQDGSITIAKLATSLQNYINNIELKANQIDLNTTNANTTSNTANISTHTLQIASLANGSPKNTFATLALLQADATANTTDGKKYTYVVLADGKWYYWNSAAWTAGGTYQSTGIADDSVYDSLVHAVSMSKVLNTLLFAGRDITTWNKGTNDIITISDTTVNFNKVDVGNSGIMTSKIFDLVKLGNPNNVYLTFKIKGTGTVTSINFWVFNSDGSTYHQFSVVPVTTSTVVQSIIIPLSYFSTLKSAGLFKICWALDTNAIGTLTISDIFLNTNGLSADIAYILNNINGNQIINKTIGKDKLADSAIVTDTISTNAITNSKVHDISSDKLINTLITEYDFKGAGIDVPQVSGGVLHLVKTVTGDTGVITNDIVLDYIDYDNVYIEFSLKCNYAIDVCLNSISTGIGAYKKNLLAIATGTASNYTKYKITIPKVDLITYGLTGGFRIWFAMHVVGDLYIKNFKLNFNGLDKSDILPSGKVTSLWNKNEFTGRFLANATTETVQDDGSILITLDVTNTPGIISPNINVNGQIGQGTKIWFYFCAKTTVDGSKITCQGYDATAYHTVITSSVGSITLTKQYKIYKVMGIVTGNIASGTNVYASIQMIADAIGATVQYKYAYWSLEEPIGDNVKDAMHELWNSVDIITEEPYGQIVDLSQTALYTPISVVGHHLVTPSVISKDDGNILKKLGVYVPTAGTYTFKVGIIDQNYLLVSDSTFNLICVTGNNVFDLESSNISVASGYQVFMDISSTNILYSITDSSLKTVPVLIQDEDNVITGAYSGMIFHDSDYMIPFGYTIIQKRLSDIVTELSDDLVGMNTEVNALSTKVDTLGSGATLLKPNGDKIRLCIDSSGNLILGNWIPSKVTIMGNSLTSNTGGIGMCASDQYHDYYYLLSQHLKSKNSGVVITDRINASTWESCTTSADRQAWWDNTGTTLFTSDTDLVVIQLVDNINTAEKLATFGVDAKTLITNIRTRCPKARVLWVAGWFADQSKVDLIQTACNERGAELVNILALGSVSANKGTLGQVCTALDGSTWTVTNPGAAAHPGNTGMQKITDAIVSVLDL